MMNVLYRLAERGILPDGLIRLGIRRLLNQRLRRLEAAAGDDPEAYTQALVQRLADASVAVHTEDANQQHYEEPTWFFASILGPRMKYSSCVYEDERRDLAQAEEDMLRLTSQRAQLADGQRILELGCGWGSLTLWMAEHFPNAEIVAVSNSSTQVAHVTAAAQARGANGVRVVKADVNEYEPAGAFDRIISIEMFEHVRNYHELFRRIERWLKPEGRLFIHVFSHRKLPYLFESETSGDWMAREFFTGGTMPSHDFLPRFAPGLTVDQDWRLNGMHYARTLEAWLRRLDQRREELTDRFVSEGGGANPGTTLQRWRMFLMACAELFAFRGGEEWGVSHYLFTKDAGS